MRTGSTLRTYLAVLLLSTACSSDGTTVAHTNSDASTGGTDAGPPGAGGASHAGSGGLAGRGGAGGAADAGASTTNGGAPLDGGKTDAGSPLDGGPTVDAADGAVAVAADRFPAAFAAAYCPTIAACCANGIAGCEAAIASQVESTLSRGLSAGNVYDAHRAGSCVAAVEALGAATCSSSFAVAVPALGACTATLDGTVAPGGKCTDPSDCRHGVMQGDTVTGFVGCAMYGGAADSRCRTFSPTTEPGAACEEGFGGSAATVSVCAGDLACSGGTCQTLPGNGAECSGRCATGLACVSSRCVPTTPVDGDCTIVACTQGSSCSDSHRCVRDAPVPWIPSFGFWSLSYACPS